MNLSKREIRTIKALAEILVPHDGAFPHGYKDIDIVAFFEEFLSGVPGKVKWFLFFNLWIFEYFSWISLLYCTSDEFENEGSSRPEKSFSKNLIFWLRTPGIFSKMPEPFREKIIVKMRNNRYFAIRGIYLLTSIVMLLSFYSNREVMDKISYFGYRDNANKIN